MRKKIFTLTVVLLSFFSSGFVFKEVNLKEFVQDKGKLKVKINYTEGPNQADFFIKKEEGNFLKLDNDSSLIGKWHGKFELKRDSIYWINSGISKKIINTINFGQYNVFFNFNPANKKNKLKLEVSQEDISYESVNVSFLDDYKISYWTSAKSLNWLEVIRGKVFKLSNNELFCKFQTTVYEEKIPIYAFRGETVLYRW